MEYSNYEQMTVSSLKNLARERGLREYSRLNRSELIKKLRESIPPIEPTREELRQLARERERERERGLRGFSRLNKTELLQRLRTSEDQILDRNIDARMANVPFLMPTCYVPQHHHPLQTLLKI